MNGLQGLPRLWRGALLAIVALTWMAAGNDAHAAKDKAMCAGLTGVLHGLCTAGAALECGADTRNQNQCDKLADKFEGVAGTPPPWEDPVDPPPPGDSATLILDSDGFDLDAGAICENYAQGNVCGPPGVDDTDFWATVDQVDPSLVVLVLNDVCADAAVTVGVKVVPLPFADVGIDDTGDLADGLSEVSLGANDTMVIRTCTGDIFKVGNRTFDVGTVTLAFARFELEP